MRKKALSLALALVMCLGLAVPALAAPEQNIVHASNEKELKEALKSNTTIILDDKTYSFDDTLRMSQLENVTINGTGSTRIIVRSNTDPVIGVGFCQNITLDGLIMGHDVAPDTGCSNAVLKIYCASVTILNCDLFGCGRGGISSSGDSTNTSTINMRNSVIRDCTWDIMELWDTNATFQNCVFSGNGYALDSYSSVTGIGVSNTGRGDWNCAVLFEECTFTDNKQKKFISLYPYNDERTPTYTLNNCQFHNNGWSDPVDTGPIQPQQPTQPVQPTSTQAMPSNDSLTVNGTMYNATVYKINDSNYFKIRDLAAILNGTEKQFSVGYDNEKQSVTAATGQGYDKLDTDLTGAPAGAETAEISNDAIYVNGEKVEAEVYKIGGMNYFKLRDLGKALNFYVGWTQETGMFIETDKPYSE